VKYDVQWKWLRNTKCNGNGYEIRSAMDDKFQCLISLELMNDDEGRENLQIHQGRRTRKSANSSRTKDEKICKFIKDEGREHATIKFDVDE
jgi:hypothetical protein